MTVIINCYGGPGVGKSTTAAALFSEFKQRGINAELVREYVKSWAWEGRAISDLDQFYIFGKQLRSEACLLGKVDVIVSDSPVLLGVFYTRHYKSYDIADNLSQCVDTYWKRLEAAGHKHVHWMLPRHKPYNPAGRYQTEQQATEMDIEMWNLMLEKLPTAACVKWSHIDAGAMVDSVLALL